MCKFNIFVSIGSGNLSARATTVQPNFIRVLNFLETKGYLQVVKII